MRSAGVSSRPEEGGGRINGIPYQHTEVKVKSDAIFAQVEGHVTSQIDLVGGWRLTKDRKTGVDNSVVGQTGPIDYDNTRPTWLGGINYRPMAGVLTYAKYATGYISGGQLAGIDYQPETAKSWEVGVKADLFDRRLRTNLSLFDVRYGNLQFQTAGANLNPPVNASVVLINGGDAKAKGFEWENTLLPMDGLTLTANLGYTDFKYTRVDPIIGTLQNYLPINRPKWSATMSAQYETEDVYAGGHMVFRMDANYRSKTYLGYYTLPVDRPNPAAVSAAAVNAVTTDNSWIVNGRVALAGMDVQGGKAQVALWARNIFDNKDLANVSSLNLTGIGSIYPGSYERARTFGVDVIFDF